MRKRKLIYAFLIILLSACSGGSNDSNPAGPTNSTGNSNDSPIEDPGSTQNETGTLQGDTLTLDNADAVIQQAFEILSGRAYDNRLVSFPTIKREPSIIDGELFPSSYNFKSQTCQNSGSLVESESSSTSLTADYSNCEINGDIVNGQLAMSGDEYQEWASHFSSDFQIKFLSDGVMQVSGVFKREVAGNDSDSFSVSDFNYSLSYSGGSLRVENASTERIFYKGVFGSDDQLHGSINGSFTMFPPALQNAEISVEIASDFTTYNRATQLSYDRGLMHLTADDSVITLDADNGDSATVLITLTDSSGMVTSKVTPWSRWLDALAYTPPYRWGNVLQLPSASGDGNILTEQSFEPLLKTVFDIVTGERFGAKIQSLPNYTFPEFPLALVADTPDGFGSPVLETCNDRGDVYLLPYKFGARQITQGWDAKFDNCSNNDTHYQGLFRIRDYGNFDYSAKNFTVAGSQDTNYFDGSQSYKHRSNRDGGPTRHYYFDGTYRLQNGGDDFEIHGWLAGEYIYSYLDRLNGHFSFKSNETSQQWVTVNIIDPLLSFNSPFPDDRTFSSRPKSGLMQINAGNGNSMFLAAGNSDDNTFSVFLYRRGLPAVEEVLSWDEFESYLDFNFDLHTR